MAIQRRPVAVHSWAGHPDRNDARAARRHGEPGAAKTKLAIKRFTVLVRGRKNPNFVSVLNANLISVHMQPVAVVLAVLLVLYLLFKLFKTVFKWFLIAIVVLVVIAFFSNPDFAAHNDKLSGIKKELSREIKEKKVMFDDYKIFSLTKKKVDGEERIVGVGAFGKVWTFEEE